MCQGTKAANSIQGQTKTLVKGTCGIFDLKNKSKQLLLEIHSPNFTAEHVPRCFRNSSLGFTVTKVQMMEFFAGKVDESAVWPDVNIENEEEKGGDCLWMIRMLFIESITISNWSLEV